MNESTDEWVRVRMNEWQYWLMSESQMNVSMTARKRVNDVSENYVMQKSCVRWWDLASKMEIQIWIPLRTDYLRLPPLEETGEPGDSMDGVLWRMDQGEAASSLPFLPTPKSPSAPLPSLPGLDLKPGPDLGFFPPITCFAFLTRVAPIPPLDFFGVLSLYCRGEDCAGANFREGTFNVAHLNLLLRCFK